MSSSTPPIASEVISELSFHLRSLSHALAAALADVAVCCSMSTRDPLSSAQLRSRMGSLDATVGEDIWGHAQQALYLVDGSAVMTKYATTSADEQRVVPEAGEHFAQQMTALEVALRAANGLVATAQATGDLSEVRDSLRQLVSVLREGALPAVRTSLVFAVGFHRLANPSEAVQEDRDGELAEPLRELPHADARTLIVCPCCGAPLGSGDRTFEGSYCEACRTRFIPPA